MSKSYPIGGPPTVKESLEMAMQDAQDTAFDDHQLMYLHPESTKSLLKRNGWSDAEVDELWVKLEAGERVQLPSGKWLALHRWEGTEE